MAATAIPGLDVTEGWPRDYPRNPRIPPGGVSSQASDWLGMRSAPPNMGPQAPAEGAAQRAFNGLRRAGSAEAIGRMANKAVRAAGKVGAVGAGAETIGAMNDYKIDDPDVDSSAAGTWKALRGGDFGGAVASLGKGAIEAGMDLGSAAAKMADPFISGTKPASTAWNRTLREKFGPLLIDNSGTLGDGGAGRGFINPPNVSADATAPTALTAQPTPGVQTDLQRGGNPGLASPTGYSPTATSGVFRKGNNFTGPSGGINDGLRIGITPGMNDEAYAREARARDIYGQMAETQKQLDNATAPTPGMGGFRSTRLADPSGGSILGPSGRSLKPRDVRHMQDLQAQRDIAGMREGGEMARAGLGANTQLGVAGLSAQTQRDINERNVALGLRGQDVQLAGHRATNQLGVYNALREQGNWRATHALAESAQNFAQRQAADDHIQKHLEGLYADPSTGKPDMARVAADRAGIDRAIAGAGLDGPHRVSPLGMQRLLVGNEMLERMRANASILPFTPDKLKTMNPGDLTNLKVLPNGDREITAAGGAKGQRIPARLFQTESGGRLDALIGTGTPTNRFDILSGAQ